MWRPSRMVFRERPVARRVLAVLLAVAMTATLLSARRADACSCVPPRPPAEELARSEAVFTAVITRFERSRDGYGRIAHARVTRAWKGVTKGSNIEIHTGMGAGDCGLRFGVGETWLVYSGGNLYDYGGLYAGRCSRTARLADAKDDVAALDAAIAGETSVTPSPKDASASDASVEPVSPPRPMASDAGVDTSTSPLGAKTPPGSKGCACTMTSAGSESPIMMAALAAALTMSWMRRAYRRRPPEL
jgi:MYXO-CTERM domain-containing protein